MIGKSEFCLKMFNISIKILSRIIRVDAGKIDQFLSVFKYTYRWLIVVIGNARNIAGHIERDGLEILFRSA